MKIINFKQAIAILGYDLVKYTKGYNFRSAFATKDGQLYYFSIEDLRNEEPFLMYRTAESVNDYHGGPNQSDMKWRLADLGYKVKEPRQKCDYNSM